MKKPRKRISTSSAYLKYSSLGMQMAMTIALFAYLGHWLDGYFNTTKPYIALVFTLFGIFGSFLSLYYKLKDDNEEK